MSIGGDIGEVKVVIFFLKASGGRLMLFSMRWLGYGVGGG